ncbi:MAG: beta-glucuronidase [Ignavibacteriaceae bacterium]
MYPIQNKFRSISDISGIWKFKIDPEKTGEKEKWFNGFDSEIEIAVPGSWNEQLEEIGLLHYVGSAWFAQKIFIPEFINNKKYWIRVGSSDYNTKIWINGKFIGENNFGFLPFQFDISDFVEPGSEAEVILLINNELNYETIPQGISSENYHKENRIREETNPPARFDFSPFGGIHRPIQIITTPEIFLDRVTVDSKILTNNSARVEIKSVLSETLNGKIDAIISNGRDEFKGEATLNKGLASVKIDINNCNLWSSEDPFLYNLKIQFKIGNEIKDEYSVPIGIREIKISGNKLLLNGKQIYLKGFGKHEDYSAIGKGLFLPLMVKDFELLKWINANSFRTSHYPYAEETLFYADKKGILIIDEVPAVSLDFRFVNENTLSHHKEFIKRLIERDYNHPSVIVWSVGNEPNLVGDQDYYNGSGKKYWKEVFDHTRELDSSRPITVPNCTRAGINDPVFEFSDILSLNRYYGWYEHPGMLDFASQRLSNEMDKIYELYKKPILFTEFGSDTMPGFHSTSIQMFTEEYQSKLLEKYIEIIRSKNYTIGEHVWNFADFRTPQHFRRVVLNLKGIFTRERAPKSAAFKLREIWGKD